MRPLTSDCFASTSSKYSARGGDAVAVQAAAIDHHIGGQGAPVRLDVHLGAAGGGADEALAESELSTVLFDLVCQRARHPLVVDDAGALDTECLDARDMGFEVGGLGFAHEPSWHAVRLGAARQLVQPRALRVIGGDHELARDLDCHALFFGEVTHRTSARDGHGGFEAARHVIQTRVDDARVASGLVAGHARLLLDDDDLVSTLGQGGRGGQPDDASTNDDETGHENS
jgi:hypothetical protein